MPRSAGIGLERRGIRPQRREELPHGAQPGVPGRAVDAHRADPLGSLGRRAGPRNERDSAAQRTKEAPPVGLHG